MIFLTLVLIFIYIISVVLLAMTYKKKEMYVTFWSILFLVLPGVNTLFLILDKDNWEDIKKFFSLKRFFDDYNK